MSTRDAVIELIRQLPVEATIPEIMDQLYVRQKIEEGLRQLDAGQGVSHEEAKQRLARWLS
jgi:predicted transcriptional regulator